MVTAIVIPIICIYFYWLTQKEMKAYKEQWLQLEDVTEESIIAGFIKDIRKEKERFYYHYYIQVMEIDLQTDINTVKTKKITPYKKDVHPFSFSVGDSVRLYGKYEKEYFLINRIEKDGSLN